MVSGLTLALIIIAVLVLGFVAYVAAKSGDFYIARSVAIAAAPEAIFPRISDLRRFNEWNPFYLADSGARLHYSGPAEGVGAAYDWDSAGRAGKGRLEITGSFPSERITMRLEFMKPFSATNAVAFTLVRDGTQTTVTWAMTGRSSFLHKLMGMVCNVDKMVGGEFAKGLAGLKALAEQRRLD